MIFMHIYDIIKLVLFGCIYAIPQMLITYSYSTRRAIYFGSCNWVRDTICCSTNLFSGLPRNDCLLILSVIKRLCYFPTNQHLYLCN